MMKQPELCCYCATRPATTKDHVPPKGIFTKPRPHDLITVPSCLQCNGGASSDDEKFKAYLGMHVARYRQKGERLFKEGVLPTLKHNSALKREIMDRMEPVQLVDKDGKELGTAAGVLWDSDAHDAVIERITRGLYYHHYRRSVSATASFKIYWFQERPDLADSMLLYNVSIGNGDFVYAYNKLDDTEDSIWIYQFYNGHWSGAIIKDQVELDDED